jgi:hypothetical protein
VSVVFFGAGSATRLYVRAGLVQTARKRRCNCVPSTPAKICSDCSCFQLWVIEIKFGLKAAATARLLHRRPVRDTVVVLRSID